MVDIEIVREVYKKASPKHQYLIYSKEYSLKLNKISRRSSFSEQEDVTFSRTVSHIILGFYKIEDTVPLLQQELNLDPRTAALLGADVLDFLAPLSDPNWQPPVEDDEGLDAEDSLNQEQSEEALSDSSTVAESPLVTPQITNNQPHIIPFTQLKNEIPAPYPAATPTQNEKADIETNPALHTMARDMDQIRQVDAPLPRSAPSLNLEHNPTYMSQNQDSLRQPLSNTPSYTPTPTQNTPTPPHNPEPPRWSS